MWYYDSLSAYFQLNKKSQFSARSELLYVISSLFSASNFQLTKLLELKLSLKSADLELDKLDSNRQISQNEVKLL